MVVTFYNYRNKLFSGKLILRCGATPFQFIFLIFSSLAALFVLFPAERQKRLWLPQNHSPYFSRCTSGRVIFKEMFSVTLVLQIVVVMVLC